MYRVFPRLSFIAALGAGICVASCTQQTPTAPAPPTVAQPQGPGAVDGVYQGYAYLTEAGDTEEMLCGTNIPLQLAVADRSFTYVLTEQQVTYAPVKRFLVQIGPDGTFTSQSGAARLQGKVVGAGLTGDAYGEACSYHFDTSRPQ